MSGIFLKLLVPGAVTVIGGTALALAMTSAPIATDLGSRSTASLLDDEMGWASVRIDGRDAILHGTATTQESIEKAVMRVAEVTGVRAVANEVVLAEFVSPFPFAAYLEGDAIVLSGGYPSEAVHAAILADAGSARDGTRLLSGGPEAGAFQAAAQFGLGALKHFDEGRIELADLALTIEGRARSSEAYLELQRLARTPPTGVQVAALTITPPVASPYVWTASFDGVNLALAGNVPSEQLVEQLRALPPSNVSISTSLVLASGAPEGFDDKALNLLSALLLLERGEASVSDGTVTLSGAPESAEVAERVTAAVTAAGGLATLEPPRVADFTLAIDKAGDALRFTGFVPDAATRERLAALAGADTASLELGRGAPELFPSGLEYGIDLLSHFSEGRFELKGSRLSLGGRTRTVADFNALREKVAEGAPQGFSLTAADIRPPVANPFVFKAVKDATGSTTLTGFVPDDEARADLLTRIASLGEDKADPADGAPESFTFYAGKGLEVLARLDTGTLAFDGSDWSIEGTVDTPQKGFAADAAYSEAGLRTLGWTYEVRLPEKQAAPALPIITPYVWQAQKAADGSVSFTGFVPSDAFKAYLRTRIEGAQDGTALGAGAPDDFGATAMAGLEALLALNEGSLGLNGNRWTLTGGVDNASDRDLVQTTLAGRVNPANWQIAIQARDTAPVVTPYLWSASKRADGTVDLSGYLPNEALKSAVTTRIASLGRDTTAMASGEPSGFEADVLAGLRALEQLTVGEARFDGSAWVLSGTVASQEQGAAAIAALAAGSRQGSLWSSALEGYSPAGSAVEAVQTSEVPTPSEEPVASSQEPAIPEETPSSEPSGEERPAAPPSSEAPIEEMSPELATIPEQETIAEESAASDERSLTVVDPLPASFVFEAGKDGGQPITLRGLVPAQATAAYFGVIAGNVPVDGLEPGENLPADFIANGTAGITALMAATEGRLGFDGSRWWLRGMVEDQAQRDALTSTIAALPGGSGWSVFVGVLSPLDICRDRVAALERRNAITFESGSTRLTAASLPVIDELAIDLNLCPEATVHVEGHTDADGAEDLNLALSVSRAEAVVDALIARNVAIERLYAEGYGESMPIADNETREGKAANRRIVFSISEE